MSKNSSRLKKPPPTRTTDKGKQSKEGTCDFLSVDFNIDSSRAKVIDTFAFFKEHNSEFASFWIVIDVFCKLSIYWVFLVRHVDLETSTHLLHVQFHCLYLLILFSNPIHQVFDFALELILTNSCQI